MDSGKKVVLAIDDNPQQLESYKLFLSEKYDLRVADSVAASLSFVIKHKVDVILLDIEMPDIDGFEFLGNIKKTLLSVNAPIIIVSGNKGDDFLEKVRNSDAFGVLAKPVRQEVLIYTIERALTV